MNTKSSKSLNWAVAFLATVVLTLTLPPRAAADYGDPPGRVARIRYLQGSVSFEPAGESDWVAAVTNRPMTIGDQIWADASSRAEIQIGSATIRMDANTFRFSIWKGKIAFLLDLMVVEGKLIRGWSEEKKQYTYHAPDNRAVSHFAV
jgi:hypothetical protein